MYTCIHLYPLVSTCIHLYRGQDLRNDYFSLIFFFVYFILLFCFIFIFLLFCSFCFHFVHFIFLIFLTVLFSFFFFFSLFFHFISLFESKPNENQVAQGCLPPKINHDVREMTYACARNGVLV